ncbi:helix-turn-helix domain-containing protein [Bacillus sp. JJ1127]|uniref:helix-turn-helix domain-containing protein n=1 Tax=Bacillus sp. JJ1127 TaxID=3122952 RepID=UPI002FFFA8F7
MNYLSFEEVRERTNLTKNQLSYLIKYKQIEPINAGSWKADGGYRFEPVDVQRLVENYKDTLTLKEAANFLGRSKTYVHNAAKDGILPFKEITKGKTTERLYLRADVEMLKQKIENTSNHELTKNKQHVSLYFDIEVIEAAKKKAAKKGYKGYKKFIEDVLYKEVKEDIE